MRRGGFVVHRVDISQVKLEVRILDSRSGELVRSFSLDHKVKGASRPPEW